MHKISILRTYNQTSTAPPLCQYAFSFPGPDRCSLPFPWHPFRFLSKGHWITAAGISIDVSGWREGGWRDRRKAGGVLARAFAPLHLNAPWIRASLPVSWSGKLQSRTHSCTRSLSYFILLFSDCFLCFLSPAGSVSSYPPPLSGSAFERCRGPHRAALVVPALHALQHMPPREVVQEEMIALWHILFWRLNRLCRSL